LLVSVGLFLVALALRLYCLDCRSLWGDEVASIETAQRGVAAIITDRFGWMRVQTPLHYLIVWMTTLPVDPTTTSTLVRLPSALAGALTPPVLYALGSVLFGRAQGILAALLLAFAPIHLNYSQDLRPYAMLVLLTTLSVYCLMMAIHKGSPGWWVAWAVSTAANLLNAYFALTLVIPALVPYFAWLLQRQRNGSRKSTRLLLAAAASFAAVGLVALVVLLDMQQVPRISPELSRLSLPGLVLSPVELLTWFTQLGVGGQLERAVQLAFLLVALLGVYFAIKSGRGEGVFLCACLILIPSVILAVLGTTNVVFQRYALFTMPFYFLLIGSGLVYVAALVLRPFGARPALTAVVYAPAILVFALGTVTYMRTDISQSLTYRPDFRGAARYLQEHARPEDTILFAGWNTTVSNFYWKWQPPAHSYYALDPRLFADRGSGSVYWVFSYEGEGSPQLASDPGWDEVVVLDHIYILREGQSSGDLQSSFEHMARLLASDSRHARLATILRGCVYQANGDISRAAEAYNSAGIYFPIAGEYLQTAVGFATRGDSAEAWQEATMSKFWEPGKPEIHDWFARNLAQGGYSSESRAEMEVASALRSSP
jgi:hypothetical protein